MLFNKYEVLIAGLSIQTSMQNLDSVAQEMSELCSILYLAAILFFCGHFVFGSHFLEFVRIVITNFHVKYGLNSSRNE